MAKTARVILNPTSGGGRGRRVAPAILVGLERRGIDADLVATSAPREAEELAYEAAKGGAELLVAAGGDGTVHEVSHGILRAGKEAGGGADPGSQRGRTVLGVLPVGTGNDFAKLVGPRGSLDRSLDILARGSLRRFDAGRAIWGEHRHWFVNAGGTGIDVEVVRQIVRKRAGRTPALVKYLGGVLRALVVYRAIPLRLRLDETVVEGEMMIIAAGNGRCVGGGFWVTPDAEPDDGRFDICIVRRMTYLEALGALPRIMRGTHETHPKVEMHRAKRVEIEALGPDPLFFQLDGELHEPPDTRRLVFELHPGALPVMTASEAV